MAFSFVTKDNIKTFVNDSDEWMRPHFRELPEAERVSRGRIGKVPKGKPRLTDGTIAGVVRETAKRIVQQDPTGRVRIKKFPELEPYVNAVLTDEILPHANAGGTPREKGKKAVKDVLRNGSAAAYCYYGRDNDWFGGMYRRVYIKDIGFEKGKTSIADCNAVKMTAWYTKMDIEGIISTQEELQKGDKEYKSEWDLALLRQLITEKEGEKDQENQSEEERRKNEGNRGFYKIEHIFQKGIGATFYSYSPRLDKCVREWKNKDPRGVIPIHIWTPEPDDASPIGEIPIAISIGKQNILDFDMQMYQYGRGLLYSPPVKKWGNTPTSAIKLTPDSIIPMAGTKDSGNDFEVVDFSNSAITDYRNNSSYIKTQIYNEQGGSSDSSISASVGAVGYSKTDAGVDQQEAKLGVSENDLRKGYEEWLAQIWETVLNIHFAESKGKKDIDAQMETIERLKLDPENMTMDYDVDYGAIKFSVTAGTSETSDSKRENEDLTALLELKAKYGMQPDSKFMAVFNQIVTNSGVDDPENIMYTDEEIEFAKQNDEMMRQAQQQQLEQSLMPQPMAPMEAEQPMAGEIPMEMPIEGEIVEPLPEEMGMSQNIAQPQVDEDELETIQLLTNEGFSDDQIADALVMLRNDYTDEEIIRVLGAPTGAM